MGETDGGRQARKPRRNPEIEDQLLKAARRVLVRDGFRGLSFAAVAREAGQYTTAVPYYFGSKAGLIAALVDSTAPKAQLDRVLEEAERLPIGRENIHAQMAAWRDMFQDREAAYTMIELLPHVMRHPRLKREVAALYRSYRDYDMRLFRVSGSAPRERVRALASILIAVDEGLMIHGLLDPQDVQFDECYSVLEELINPYLERLREPHERGEVSE